MEKQVFWQQRFDSIQILRGLAALLVVTEHIRWMNRGAFGVDVFFVISGFMMMLSTQKSRTHFWRKRLLRILPPYYLLTLLTYVLLLLFPNMFEQTSGNPLYLVKSLLFIPFDVGGGVLQPIYRIGWTVNCEMFFYLLFGIAMHISFRFRGIICTGFLLGITALAWWLPRSFAPVTFYGAPVMLEFALGMGLYEVAKKLYDMSLDVSTQSNRWMKMMSLCCIAAGVGVLVYMVLTKQQVNILGFGRLIYWGVPAAFCVLLFFLGGLFLSMPKPLVGLGDMSYSIYLVHYFPILLLDRYVLTMTDNRLLLAGISIIGIGVVLVLARGFYKLIEKRGKGIMTSFR
ncbi:MAG: acyltransferase [Clostridium sp.]|jgi:peptidoglycan/LPS O-acetylase OafA/YrhL|nr:acyltransferase [Clostridium sp.]